MSSALLQKLSQRLLPAAEQSAFVDALTRPAPSDSAVLWLQPRPQPSPFVPKLPHPWQPPWVDRLEPAALPGQHPLHGQGAYYCLDPSSVFAASVLQAVPPSPRLVLDLCSAPGGKGIFAQRLLAPPQLWCNEVVHKRSRILIANLKRCGLYSARVFNLDPAVFAATAPATAALVIVDAPCSGQSLLAKGGKAEGCFHRVTISKNASRQKRILANAAQVVAGGGYLAYMTCTFAKAENEGVCRWLLKKFPQFQPVAVAHLAPYQSHLSEAPCYRLWPHRQPGAGAFTALFQRQDDAAGEVPPDFLERHGWVLHRDGF